MWRCEYCLVLNEDKDMVCACCGKNKSVHPRPQPPPPPPPNDYSVPAQLRKFGVPHREKKNESKFSEGFNVSFKAQEILLTWTGQTYDLDLACAIDDTWVACGKMQSGIRIKIPPQFSGRNRSELTVTVALVKYRPYGGAFAEIQGVEWVAGYPKNPTPTPKPKPTPQPNPAPPPNPPTPPSAESTGCGPLLLVLALIAAVFLWTSNRSPSTSSSVPSFKLNLVKTQAETQKPVQIKASASSVVFDNSFKTYNGHVTVGWSDAGNHSPYTVLYEYASDTSVTQAYFLAGTTYNKEWTFDHLIPGKRYRIDVKDNTGKVSSTTITAPAPAEFVDGRLTNRNINIFIDPRYKGSSAVKDEQAKKIKDLKASEILSGINSAQYGWRVDIRYPSLSYSRYYDTMIAIYAPNGFAYTYYLGRITYNKEASGLHWNMLGEEYWKCLHGYTNTIPSGYYRFELYFNGMFVKSTSTYVQY